MEVFYIRALRFWHKNAQGRNRSLALASLTTNLTIVTFKDTRSPVSRERCVRLCNMDVMLVLTKAYQKQNLYYLWMLQSHMEAYHNLNENHSTKTFNTSLLFQNYLSHNWERRISSSLCDDVFAWLFRLVITSQSPSSWASHTETIIHPRDSNAIVLHENSGPISQCIMGSLDQTSWKRYIYTFAPEVK